MIPTAFQIRDPIERYACHLTGSFTLPQFDCSAEIPPPVKKSESLFTVTDQPIHFDVGGNDWFSLFRLFNEHHLYNHYITENKSILGTQQTEMVSCKYGKATDPKHTAYQHIRNINNQIHYKCINSFKKNLEIYTERYWVRGGEAEFIKTVDLYTARWKAEDLVLIVTGALYHYMKNIPDHMLMKKRQGILTYVDEKSWDLRNITSKYGPYGFMFIPRTHFRTDLSTEWMLLTSKIPHYMEATIHYVVTPTVDINWYDLDKVDTLSKVGRFVDL